MLKAVATDLRTEQSAEQQHEKSLGRSRLILAESAEAKRSVGIHWGTFDLTDESLDQPPKDLMALFSVLAAHTETAQFREADRRMEHDGSDR